jgi:subtilisin family serine protease
MKTAPPLSIEDGRCAVEEGTGTGVRIAVLDSGIDTHHPELRSVCLADDIVVRQNGLRLTVEEGGTTDLYGHGTAIAGTLHRWAPEATIGSIRVLNERLGGKTEAIREGVRQAFDRGYQILNCSFGCRGDARYVMHYKEWVDEAYLHGIHIVAASNNFDYGIPEWPAHFPTVVAVSMGRLEALEFTYRRKHLVEFSAAGWQVEVPWLNGQRKVVSGSSYAAPHMTAVIARVLSVWPELSPLEIKTLLRRLAVSAP